MSSSSFKLHSMPYLIRRGTMFEPGGLLLITPQLIWLSGVAMTSGFRLRRVLEALRHSVSLALIRHFAAF
ncbi:hypothetical protein [Undibacterium luofuense]|uniref:Uncharacterized protein n=1 Tax=Undibacterium luofuense TaxID=2828733 RepID=A0A941DQP1_9BURK|nr:hypothetical protein [Undibacterium luofuense]MBR7784069.1 hypothetical protein [Undibacterium luofuense]